MLKEILRALSADEGITRDLTGKNGLLYEQLYTPFLAFVLPFLSPLDLLLPSPRTALCQSLQVVTQALPLVMLDLMLSCFVRGKAAARKNRAVNVVVERTLFLLLPILAFVC